MSVAIRVRGVHKTFKADAPALSGIDVDVHEGEMVALIGASGSGKSTLLRVMAGLLRTDRLTTSSVEILGKTLQSSGDLAPDVRRQRARIGMIFQQFNLVGRLSVFLNTVLGALGRMPRWRGCLGWFYAADKQRAMRALDRVGMAAAAGQRASTLSGGQQQRVAIARALVQQPDIVLADEPIASLDPESARKVMDALAALNQDGMTVLVSLHQVDYALHYCKRTIALKAGEIVFDGPSQELTPKRLSDLYGAEVADLYIDRRDDSADSSLDIDRPLPLGSVNVASL